MRIPPNLSPPLPLISPPLRYVLVPLWELFFFFFLPDRFSSSATLHWKFLFARREYFAAQPPFH